MNSQVIWAQKCDALNLRNEAEKILAKSTLAIREMKWAMTRTETAERPSNFDTMAAVAAEI